MRRASKRSADQAKLDRCGPIYDTPSDLGAGEVSVYDSGGSASSLIHAAPELAYASV
jgi:hypothetical protein